jgi:hypothetical protein
MDFGLGFPVDSERRTIWIVDAHRDDGKRFVVRADEMLTAFMELEAAHAIANRLGPTANLCNPEQRLPEKSQTILAGSRRAGFLPQITMHFCGRSSGMSVGYVRLRVFTLSFGATATESCWSPLENSRQGLGQAGVFRFRDGSATYSQPSEGIFRIGQAGLC